MTLDDDLQNPPEEIAKLLAVLDNGADVVYGTPENEQHGFLRDQSSRITKLALQSAMGAETARNVSAFRVFRTRIRDAFATYRGPFVSIDVLLTWGTTRFSHVTVRHEPRRVGASNYTFRKLVTHAFNMMTGFSTLPLQIASLIGFLFTLFGFAILVYVLGQLPDQRRRRPGLRLPCLDHRDLQRRPAVRARHHRRVPGADALSHDGSADLPGPGSDRRRLSADRSDAARADRRRPRMLAGAVGFGDLRVPGRPDQSYRARRGCPSRRSPGRVRGLVRRAATCAWSPAGSTTCSCASRWPSRDGAFASSRWSTGRVRRVRGDRRAQARHPGGGGHATDVAAIEEVAYTSFTTGRFLLDQRLPPELSRRRYSTWVRTSFESARQTVLKAEVDGDLVGLLHRGASAGRSVYWHLTAIAPGGRERAWGRASGRRCCSGTGRRVRRSSRRRSPATTCRSSTCMRGSGFRSRRPR